MNARNDRENVSKDLKEARFWGKMALVNAILATVLAAGQGIYCGYKICKLVKEKHISSGKPDVGCVADAHVESVDCVAASGCERMGNAVHHARTVTIPSENIRITATVDDATNFGDGNGYAADVGNEDAVKGKVGFGRDAGNVVRLKTLDGTFGCPGGTIGRPRAKSGDDACDGGNDEECVVHGTNYTKSGKAQK